MAHVTVKLFTAAAENKAFTTNVILNRSMELQFAVKRRNAKVHLDT